MNREEIQGFEYDWIATDSDGHVAFFSTAGAGYAPDQFLRDVESFDAAIAAMLAANPTTEALLAPPVGDGCENTWQLMAERGVFAFDCNPNGGPYRLVSVPKKPARVFELPEEVSRVAGAIVLNLCVAHRLELTESTLQNALR